MRDTGGGDQPRWHAGVRRRRCRSAVRTWHLNVRDGKRERTRRCDVAGIRVVPRRRHARAVPHTRRALLDSGARTRNRSCVFLAMTRVPMTCSGRNRAPRILVTGASGFIGSHVCDRLIEMGAQVIGVDRIRPSRCRYEHVSLDIGAEDASSRLGALGAFDAVIHLAARAEVVVPDSELQDLWRTNVGGLLNVVRGTRTPLVVFASSCAVYGTIAGRAVQPTEHAVQPIGVYGMSKAAGE